MASRSPDAIQREIEATRAELAQTIDTIADRVSPKKVVGRSVETFKSRASAAFGHADPPSPNGRPAAVLDATPAEAAHPRSPGRHLDRTLRTDRVLLTIGVAAALAGAVVLFRCRRR